MDYIKVYKSFLEIEKIIGISKYRIFYCCLDKIKTAYGYVWEYLN